MCLFSGPPVAVHSTRIFARPERDRQVLVYSMRVTTREPVAMVLPLPVPRGTREDAVRFTSLERYPTFFEDMERTFAPATQALASLEADRGAALQVHRVGKFVASFAPTFADMQRLDPRFRLADGVLDSLPDVKARGFAVFQLDVTPGEDELVHPMAFEFPRADPARVFFPTLHVHDGAMHAYAEFDHVLYLQAEGELESLDARWTRAQPGQRVASAMRLDATSGLVKQGLRLARCPLVGRLPNEDQYAVA